MAAPKADSVDSSSPVASAASGAAAGAAAGDAGDAAPAPEYPVVVRKDIRYLPPAEQERYATAILKMMENKDGKPESSDFFRLAGYHGWPSQYCAHGIESFPSWHRAYLLSFEQALQDADRALGRDGNIALPYWDWTDLDGPDKKNPEPFPRVLRKHFSDLPKHLMLEVRGLARSGIKRRADAQMRRALESSDLVTQVVRCLQERLFSNYASTGGDGASVEAPHNSVHVCVGAPMNSVPFAAFDPTFWLHHCNIDRIHEKYVQTHPTAKAEFEADQKTLAQNFGEVNLFEKSLNPFIHPRTKKTMTTTDTFDSLSLGYKYDSLPEVPQQLRELPTYAVFDDVYIPALKLHCYELHVFVHRKDEEFKIPESVDNYAESKNYAGMGAVFGGKEGCENCIARLPFRITVDITATLHRLGLSRYDAVLTVMCEDDTGKLSNIVDTPLPRPVIRGPLFERVDEVLHPSDSAPPAPHGDTLSMQSLLSKMGLYEGKVDGWYGPKTLVAIKQLQKHAGLPESGQCDKTTKKALMKPKFDVHHIDDKANYTRGSVVTYWVGQSPGYLSRDCVLADVQSGFDAWKEASGVTFKRDEDRKKADIEVIWHGRQYHRRLAFEQAKRKKKEEERKKDEEGKKEEGKEEGKKEEGKKEEGKEEKGEDLLAIDPEAHKHLLEFDGAGGQLAHSAKNYIHLDSAEHWISGEHDGKGDASAFRLRSVVAHEVGHVLGLGHSSSPHDLMSEFYVEDRIVPQAGDIARLSSIYPGDASAAS